jgi:hypothetical protein
VLWKGTTGDPHAPVPDPGLLAIGVAEVLEAIDEMLSLTRGVQGGAAARRSAAEPDELRIPPGSWDAPQGAGHERKSLGERQ